MNDRYNILILSAGRRVELVQLFRDALTHHFPEAKVFATDFKPHLSAACNIVDKAFKVPQVTDASYVDCILDLCTQHAVGMVIPTIDLELDILGRRYQEFADLGINLIVSEASLVSACRDKRKTGNIYSQIDLPQPAIYAIEDLKFPCFCKPYDGSSSNGALPLYNAEMLTKSLLENEKNMFMEFVGKNYSEYTICAYFDKNSRLRCLVPRERIEVRGGEVSKSATRKNFAYEYLLPRLNSLKGARGCITVQVFVNIETKKIKALEINPRFGGGFPLTNAAGACYPDWLIREYFLQEEIPFYDAWESNLLMLRYDAKVLIHEN